MTQSPRSAKEVTEQHAYTITNAQCMAHCASELNPYSTVPEQKTGGMNLAREFEHRVGADSADP